MCCFSPFLPLFFFPLLLFFPPKFQVFSFLLYFFLPAFFFTPKEDVCFGLFLHSCSSSKAEDICLSSQLMVRGWPGLLPSSWCASPFAASRGLVPVLQLRENLRYLDIPIHICSQSCISVPKTLVCCVLKVVLLSSCHVSQPFRMSELIWFSFSLQGSCSIAGFC